MATRKYGSLEEYLEEKRDIVRECVTDVVNKHTGVDIYIYTISDKFFGRSKEKREHYINNFIEQYKIYQDKKADFKFYPALYATTMQLLADYYVQEANKQNDC